MTPEEIGEVTFRGDVIDDLEILDRLPLELQELLRAANGFILWRGGLHVRGACVGPEWHSLRVAMEGDESIVSLYAALESGDVPFAQDSLGDQFILRNGEVHVLAGETGELEELSPNLGAFFASVAQDPEEFLNINLNHRLEPGQLIFAFPPFCIKSEGEVALRAISAQEVIGVHAHFASEISQLPDGAQVRFSVPEE